MVGERECPSGIGVVDQKEKGERGQEKTPDSHKYGYWGVVRLKSQELETWSRMRGGVGEGFRI